MMTANNRFQASHSATIGDNTGAETMVVLGLQAEHEAVFIFAHILYLKHEYISRGTSGGGCEWECLGRM